jgi:hypothetical protein
MIPTYQGKGGSWTLFQSSDCLLAQANSFRQTWAIVFLDFGHDIRIQENFVRCRTFGSLRMLVENTGYRIPDTEYYVMILVIIYEV